MNRKQKLILSFIISAIAGLSLAFMPEFLVKSIGAFAIGWVIRDIAEHI